MTIMRIISNMAEARGLLDSSIGLLSALIQDGTALCSYSQRDPLWRNAVFAASLRFETDGCYVCAVSDIVAMARYDDDPPTVAAKLHQAGCFGGALLEHPERIPDAYQRLGYDSTLRWHDGPADTERIFAELADGPIIAEVDFKYKTQKLNQHFVVLIAPTADGNDIWINDPWDGSRVRLMQKYAQEHWDLARTIYGLRLLRVVGDV